MENFLGLGYLFFLTIMLYSTVVAGDLEDLQQPRVIVESDLEHDIAQEANKGSEDDKVLGDKDDIIVGGVFSKRGEHPWIARIWAYRNPKHPYSFCGGSLVHKQWVLTAAHCVKSYKSTPKILKITAGDHDLTKKDPGEQIVGVCRVIVHSGYKNNMNDIALLKLCKPVKLSKTVKLIKMAPKTLKVPTSQTLGVAGWGATKEGGSGSDKLKKVFVKKVEFSACKKKYSNTNNGNICAGVAKGGKDSCQGDSGGPMWWSKNKIKYLVGVVSWGRGCARPGLPGVYAKVSYYRSWIDGKMGAKDDDEEHEKIVESSSIESNN